MKPAVIFLAAAVTLLAATIGAIAGAAARERVVL